MNKIIKNTLIVLGAGTALLASTAAAITQGRIADREAAYYHGVHEAHENMKTITDEERLAVARVCVVNTDPRTLLNLDMTYDQAYEVGASTMNRCYAQTEPVEDNGVVESSE